MSVDATGLMDVQVPEGGDLRVACVKPSGGGGSNYCDVAFSSSIGGRVVGVAPACLPEGLYTIRCTGVSSRKVTMGS
ncbi:MAG TPA: hypothetical protein VM266_00110, partial [Solirubrobacteraceae bacterium]|nr:hypothetical protein [Solirubrobacteraceae bacterium]